MKYCCYNFMCFGNCNLPGHLEKYRKKCDERKAFNRIMKAPTYTRSIAYCNEHSTRYTAIGRKFLEEKEKAK